MIPPLFVYVRRRSAGGRWRPGWLLPVFLLYPLLLAIYLLILPWLVLAGLFGRRGAWRALRIGSRAAGLICAMRGLSVSLRDEDQRIDIRTW